MPRSLPAGLHPARRSAPVLLISCFLLSLLPAAPSHAGANDDAQAWLTWSSSGVQSDLTSPGSLNNLYIRVTGVGSFKGAEFDLVWTPLGDAQSCFTHLATLFPTSTGCTYLNKGTAVPVTTADTLGYLHVAWASPETNTSCSEGGNIVKLQYEFDGCDDEPGCFRLASLLLLDADGQIANASIEGAEATVLGGTALCGELDGGNAFLGSPPSVGALVDYTLLQGTTLTVVPSATDADGDTLTWSGSNLPDGASLDSTTGTLVWTPEEPGTFRGITLTATDGVHSSSSAFSVYSLEETDSAGDALGQMGLFRVINSPSRDVDMRALGAQWTYRDIRPNLDAAYQDSADADLWVFGPQRVEVVFNIVRADSIDPDNRYVSRAPSTPTEWALWHVIVDSLVERYDGDGDRDMPGLPIAVHYWHLEEEDTFWRDFADSSYFKYVDSMATWIHAKDASAKVISMGLGSDNTWTAAKQAGFVRLDPVPCDAPSDSFDTWLDRTSLLLSSGAQDIVDLHCYEVYPIIKGKLDWVRDLMGENQKPIWIFEAAGPFTQKAGELCDEPDSLAYTDALNGRYAWTQFAQAFGNGVTRMAWAYKGKGTETQQCDDFDCDPRFRRTALMDDTSFVRHQNVAPDYLERGECCADTSKPSFRNYQALNRYIRGFTSAVDSTIIPSPSLKENDYIYKVGFSGPATDEEIWVVWRPQPGTTDSVSVFVPTSWTDSVEVAQASQSKTSGIALSHLRIVNHRVRVPLYPGIPRVVSRLGYLTSIAEELAPQRQVPSVRVLRQGSRIELAWAVLSGSEPTAIEVYDVRGRQLHRADLRRARGQLSGTYSWSPYTSQHFATGIYFARVKSGGDYSPAQRFLLLR